jgi:phosphoribosylamine--glycine ligase
LESITYLQYKLDLWATSGASRKVNVLLIGGGGREHALAWKLAQSPLLDRLYCVPGNAGIAEVAECVALDVADHAAVIGFCKKCGIGLAVIGPEVPLVAGLTDDLEAAGIKVFGPSKAAAELEGSKGFTKDLCAEYGIPTAAYRRFTDAAAAKAYAKTQDLPVVIKADGLAAGKGVVIAKNLGEAENAIDQMMGKRVFGRAGDRVLIEECLVGEETSMLALVDGKSFVTLPSSQDHKRIFDNDQGPNTGGMGAYSPAPVVSETLLKQIEREVFHATVNGLAAEGIEYRGVLYAGIMVTKDGPKVLEFNVRFGDPETQAILPRLDFDLVDAMNAVIDGRLSELKLPVTSEACVSVVMASGGYPGKYANGKSIRGLPDAAKLRKVVVFHAGTKAVDGDIVTQGGRVLGVTALGKDIRAAVARAYEAVEKIQFEGAQYRKDIAARALNRGV